MEEVGHFFIEREDVNVHKFISKHSDVLLEMSVNTDTANSKCIEGVYVEYRPNRPYFTYVIPRSKVLKRIRGVNNE